MIATHSSAPLTISLHDLPRDGKKITVTDQTVWQSGIEEFGLDCRVISPLTATISLLMTTAGCVVRGHLSGDVLLSCSRCAEEVAVPLAWDIDDFEPLPKDAQKEYEEPSDALDLDAPEEDSRIVLDGGLPLLDLGALLWEEFLLALPQFPLCSPSCKGLCPICGGNRNHTECTCQQETGDPRLAIFRKLTLQSRNAPKGPN